MYVGLSSVYGGGDTWLNVGSCDTNSDNSSERGRGVPGFQLLTTTTTVLLKWALGYWSPFKRRRSKTLAQQSEAIDIVTIVVLGSSTICLTSTVISGLAFCYIPRLLLTYPPTYLASQGPGYCSFHLFVCLSFHHEEGSYIFKHFSASTSKSCSCLGVSTLLVFTCFLNRFYFTLCNHHYITAQDISR